MSDEASESDDASREAAWEKEIRRRLDDLDAGRVQPVPWPEARRLILETSRTLQ
jgi:hypothetical protein